MTTLVNDGSVEFRFLRSGAGDVVVTGDFDAWTGRHTMTADDNGWWTLQLKLAPGDYRFRYVADGEWFTDFASNGVEFTKTGWNSILVIPGAESKKTSVKQQYTGDALLVA